MLLVGVVGCGLASLRYASFIMLEIISNATLFILLFGSLRSRFAREPKARSWWFGFALFGWPSFGITLSSMSQLFLSDSIPFYLAPLYTRFDPTPIPPLSLPEGAAPMPEFAVSEHMTPIAALMSVDFYGLIHASIGMYSSLVNAWLGGLLAGYLHDRQERSTSSKGGS
jgi:hypothetical protein